MPTDWFCRPSWSFTPGVVAGWILALTLLATPGQATWAATAATDHTAVTSTAVTPDFRQPLEAAVRRHVLQQLQPAASDRLTVAVLRWPLLPSGSQPTGVTSPLNKEHYNPRTVAQVTFLLPDGTQRTLGIPLQVTWEKTVWVLQTPVAAGQPLSLQALRLERRAVDHNVTHLLPTNLPVDQYEAKVLLRPKTLLDDRKIERIPAVRARQAIRIRLKPAKGMLLTVDGIALQDGTVGQVVRVRQTRFEQKPYNARVIGPGLVEVAL